MGSHKRPSFIFPESPSWGKPALLPILILFLSAATAWPSIIEKKNGKSLEGTILERDDHYLYLETAAGVENIPLGEITKLDGRAFLLKPRVPSNSEYPRTAKFKLGPAAKIRTEFHDDEVKAFYEAHPGRFKTPPKVKLMALEFPTKPESARVAEILRKAKQDPRSVLGWKDMGWFEKGNEMGDQRIQDLFPEEADQIFALNKGEVSGCLRSNPGVYYIFWAKDRQEARLPPLAKIRKKVKWEMMNEQGKRL